MKQQLINNVVARNLKYASFYSLNENSNSQKNNLNLPETEYFIHHFDIKFLNELIPSSRPKRYSRKTQSWKGIVTEVNEDSFSARLYDQTQNDTYEIGDFEIRVVSPEDKEYLKIGGIFYWSVGHFMENGTSINKSEIRFQRLILLTEEDINSAINESSTLFGQLKEGVIE